METLFQDSPHCQRCHAKLTISNQVNIHGERSSAIATFYVCTTCLNSLAVISYIGTEQGASRDAKFEPDKMQHAKFLPFWTNVSDTRGQASG